MIIGYGIHGMGLEAISLFQNMLVVDQKPDDVTFIGLLSGCGHAGLVGEGMQGLEDAYKLIQEMPLESDSLGPEGTRNFVLLSNIYSTDGRWDDTAVMQKSLGFKKIPGSSWIEVDGVIHAFLGGDQSHPESAKINAKLLQLRAEMKKLGDSAEANFVYQDVEEEEKEHILLYHSEKLAVAVGLLNMHGRSLTSVTKNLRVCGD
ncbi:OLC1v1031537C1 [Oldenlandia corymbosa var. corymbosa]|uniref:OLC1v1031537C1 n=1 Tax=Oldenlandia corymbosa var. corymbosa TaxID=529605 RepID=A0AAV1CIL7_OLDCO|nr:OLC1v1031537C1 [Oldenlandia corymbosa var. corymbosa]